MEQEYGGQARASSARRGPDTHAPLQGENSLTPRLQYVPNAHFSWFAWIILLFSDCAAASGAAW